jgi:ArsR family transcriptional regulator, cadmium/lead-responsive transcriptional repressor
MTMNRAVARDAAVLLFHSLADPTRLAIVKLLADRELRVVDLTGELGLAQSTVSGHLACLRDAGLVDPHPHGRATYYRIATAELWPLLSAAEALLHSAGRSAAICPEAHRDRLVS